MPRRILHIVASVLVVGSVVVGADSPVSAATITVNTTADPGASGTCSLREAVAAANTDTAVGGCAAGSGADVIELPVGTVTLATGVILVTSPVSITGTGMTGSVIDGNGAARIFSATAGAPLTFTDLTMQNTGPGGAGVESDASVTLVRTRMTAVSGALFGSGILTTGDVSLTASQIDNASGTSGVAIVSLGGAVTLSGSTIADNAGDSSGAGAVYGQLSVTVADSTFANNSGGDGGAILTPGMVVVTSSTFTSNVGVRGGAIAAAGTISVADSSFVGNRAQSGGGGALLSYQSAVTVDASLFRGNTALEAASGIGGAIAASGQVTISDSEFDANQATYGGAVYATRVSATRSTFSANQGDYGSAIGAALAGPGDGVVNVTSSTFDSNVAANAAPNVGGAIYADGPGSTVQLSTFAANSAVAGADIFVENAGTISLAGNIFAATASGSNCAGAVTSLGANVAEEVVDSCALNGPGDLPATSVQLGPLQLNAPGATPTRALPAGSPAIDLVETSICPTNAEVDQRGVVRADGSATGPRCDAGAYEFVQTIGSVTLRFTSADPALSGQSVSFTMSCPGAPGSPFSGTALINGADTTITGIGIGIVCTVTPTYPPGVRGPESFDTPEVTEQTPAVIASVAVFGATTPTDPTTTTTDPATTTTDPATPPPRSRRPRCPRRHHRPPFRQSRQRPSQFAARCQPPVPAPPRASSSQP